MAEHTSADDRLKGPLSGVRVIEMGQLVAGPFVGSRMADFGSEAIKFESPGRGDAMRHWGYHRYNSLLYTSPSPLDLSTIRMPSTPSYKTKSVSYTNLQAYEHSNAIVFPLLP